MATNESTIINEIDALCGRIVDGNGLIPEKYLEPWRGDKGTALAVVAPDNDEDIRKLIALAKKHRFRILPQGARTGLVGASVPENIETIPTVILSTEKIRNTIIYNHHEQSITVSAGYHLSEINDYLKQHDVEVPINVSSDPMAGAMAATNIAGASVVKYGDFRKLCNGIKVVIADEDINIFSSISKPRKDNSSLDFTGLFIGSFGTCGIITEVELKVVPRIMNTSTLWLSLAAKTNLSEAITKIEHILKDQLLACEFISAQALKQLVSSEENLNNNLSVPFSDSQSDVILVELGSSDVKADMEPNIENLVSVLVAEGLAEDALIVPPTKSWELRHKVSEAVQKTGKLVACDISVTRDKFDILRNKCVDAVQKISSQYLVCDFGHIGDGGVHMNIVIPQDQFDSSTDEQEKTLRSAISKIAVELGGSFSAEHGIGKFNQYLYEEFQDPVIRLLSKKFKTACDPDNVLGHSSIEL